jgi:DeoR/GlpR family transcriptional regulator of sugar metabolism
MSELGEPAPADPRQSRQAERQRAISEAVMAEGAVRLEQLAERFDISLMTVHRDLDELESRGILRKSRGVATAMSTSLIESSDVYRLGRQHVEKAAIARAALDEVEPGQAVFLDDSTTVLQLGRLLVDVTPLTVITNALTLMSELRGAQGLSLIALGGSYVNWSNAFLGRMTTEAIATLRADTAFLSTSAIVDGVGFHQSPEIVDAKRAMFESAARRILLVDHTKFEQRALHTFLPLTEFDLVIVDAGIAPDRLDALRERGVTVRVADPASPAR